MTLLEEKTSAVVQEEEVLGDEELFYVGQRFENPFAPQHLLPTLWMFTESDFATFVIPNACFGLFGALAGPLLTDNERPDLSQILSRTLLALLFNWSNVLIQALANQCEPDSVLEDTLNKPWRPIPSGRITSAQTRLVLMWALPSVLALNWYLGALIPTTLFFHLTWIYTHLGGGDGNWLVRNLILAAAYGLCNVGSLQLVAGPDVAISPRGFLWVLLISGVAITTAQVPDMKDQAGDARRDRRTCPLVLGDEAARWSIAVPVAVWSLALPRAFFALGFLGCLVPTALGALIVYRILRRRDQVDDYYTWKVWTIWIAVLYALPLFAAAPRVFAAGASSLGAAGA